MVKHGQQGDERVPLRHLADDTWIGQFFSSTNSVDIVRFTLADLRPEKFTRLTRVWERTSLAKSYLAPAEDFRWRSADRLEIQGWLYRARATGHNHHIHGGPTGVAEDRVVAEIQWGSARTE